MTTKAPFLFVLAVLMPACATAPRAAGTPAALARRAIVDQRFAGADGSAQDGVPVFHSIRAALAAAPRNGRYEVLLHSGRYHEKLSVDRPEVTLLGAGRDSTVVTWDASADTRDSAGVPYGTRGSFTLRVTAPDFHAAHLTIENAFDFDANARKPESDTTRVRNTQGVALATTAGSDRAVFEDVRLSGHQDTFFANAGRHYFHHCEIDGNVDFIFGAGQAVFDDCDIISLDRQRPGDVTVDYHGVDNGYITAPSTDMRQPYGFLFTRSRLRKGSPDMALGSVALGRPWHPSATVEANGSAIFMDCWMDDHIAAVGWVHMSSVDSASKVRYWFEPGSARFLEYHSTGPGAVASPVRRVMSDGDARSYTTDRVLGGWVPERLP